MRRSWLLSFALLGASAQAEILYRVTIPADSDRVQVTIKAPVKGDSIEFAMPNWAPGAYNLSDFAKQLADIAAKDSKGNPLMLVGDAPNRWKAEGIEGGTITVTYTAPVRKLDGAIHMSGPGAYMYVVGRKSEPCRLEFGLPDGWPVFVGLDAAKGKDAYQAPDYDVLADNPVSAGPSLVDTYIVDKKPHTIVLLGEPRHDVNRSRLLEICRFVTLSQRDFFGGLPYKKYVWHFFVSDSVDGGWGLEHLSSTQIGLAGGLGKGMPPLLAHEFFHLWNVKRIRSAVLGPFDYDVLPKTGALWWLEGVTDYYADYLLHRYRWMNEEDFFSSLVGNADVRNEKGYPQVSAHDSSYRVGEANNGRGNSSGYLISYYPLGWIVGFVLDIEIRSQSKGKHSLDDVTRALYAMTKDGKPGFAEDEIRKQCIKFGGETLGAFYDRVVMKAGDVPVEEQLAKMGLRMVETEEAVPTLGFRTRPSKADQGAIVFGAGADGVVKNGDIIVSIAGVSLAHKTNRAIQEATTKATESLVIGKAIPVVLKREGGEVTVEVTPSSTPRKRKVVQGVEAPTAAQKAFRDAYLKAKSIPKV